MKYYVDIAGKTAGPFTLSQMKLLRESAQIEDSFLYVTDESQDWMPVSLLVPLLENPEENTPKTVQHPQIVINNANNNNSNNQGFYPTSFPVVLRKSKNTYQILAFLLGSLGVHNFYAGRSSIGAIQLALTIFSLGFASILVWIWAIVEIFVVKNDGHNVPMV